MAVAPIGAVRRVVEFALTQMEPGKILLGFPNYAYDWTLPFTAGATRAQSIGNEAAPLLAAKLAAAFRAQSALWIGYRDGRSAEPVLNPPDHVEIAPGTLLYYLADARIDSARVPWAALAAA